MELMNIYESSYFPDATKRIKTVQTGTSANFDSNVFIWISQNCTVVDPKVDYRTKMRTANIPNL